MNKIVVENLIMRAVFDVLTGKNADPKKKPWAYLKSWDWYNEYLYSVKVRFY